MNFFELTKKFNNEKTELLHANALNLNFTSMFASRFILEKMTVGKVSLFDA